MTPRKVANAVLTGLFIACISAYGAASAWNALGDRAELDKIVRLPWRALPVWTESFYNDHLAGRSRIISAHAHLKADWLGASPNPKVCIGRDGWLFYNHNAEAGFVTPHDPNFSERLDRWAAALSARRSWLGARGIRFLVVAAPNKQSVYPEYLPRLARHRGPTPLDELLARCRQDPDLRVVDLRAPLRAARPIGRLFWLSDTHWSPVGGYAGYAATMAALADWYPGVTPTPWSAFGLRSAMFSGGDLARMIGLEKQRIEDVPRLTYATPQHARQVVENISYRPEEKLAHVRAEVWANDVDNLPRVVVLGDSFADFGYCDLLAEHFSRLVRVGSYQQQEQLIAREQPDLVIFEFVERMLEGFEPRN